MTVLASQRPNISNISDLNDFIKRTPHSTETTSDSIDETNSFHSTRTTFTNVSSQYEFFDAVSTPYDRDSKKSDNCKFFTQKCCLALNKLLEHPVNHNSFKDLDRCDAIRDHSFTSSNYVLSKYDITLIAIIGIGSMYLIVTAALATPIVDITSLSLSSSLSLSHPMIQTKLNASRTWDVGLVIQNLEMWKGSYRVTNCSLYKQVEKRVYYEEERSNLILAAMTDIDNDVANDEGFSLKWKEEKYLKLKMNDVGAKGGDWEEGSSFAILVSVNVIFGGTKLGYSSGMADYECGGFTIDKKTGLLLNDVPMNCELTVPLFT